jgi:signal transduction histidine kinase/DNA-binding LacI/PurR family transcriptional regulator
MKKNRQASTGSLPNTRTTIGYLAHGIDNDVSEAIWAGMADAARRRDVNLVCFVGHELRNPNGFLAQANVLYDLIDRDLVDGLVIYASAIATSVDQKECAAFIRRYHPLPTISLGTALPGIPCVRVESYQGMREVLIHLIEVHGHHRVAFIRGPENHPYAQQRYKAYTDTLAEYGISVEPALVTPPCDWSRSDGYDMIQLLLDQRGLQLGSELEAIVAASDVLALGALEALQDRRIQVPEEVGIAGFNDSLEARAVTPPLTSVAATFYKQGEQALDMMLAMLSGEQLPEQVVLPARLVVRQSCGCADLAVVKAEVKGVQDHSDRAPKQTISEVLTETHQQILISEMMQASRENLSFSQAEQLVKTFVDELEHNEIGTFLATLGTILAQVTIADGDARAWQYVISALRRHALSCLVEDETQYRIENLFQQARVLLGEMAQRSQLHREVQSRQYGQVLRTIGQSLIGTFDMAKLREILAKQLPALGIPSCYLSLYENPKTPTERARLILAYDQDKLIELDDERFPSSHLVPRRLLASRKRYTMIVTSLYFEESQLGVALFEMGPADGATYGTLRGQISSALRGALLLQERQRAEQALAQAYARVEEQVEERTHELQQEIAEHERTEKELQRYRDRLEDLVAERTRELEEAQAELVRQERLSALGQLTATVAHEIRNPLGTVRTAVFSVGDAIERDEMHRVERALHLAERNIVRCDGIITELLDYTRDQVLQTSPTQIDTWLNGLLNEALEQRAIPESITLVTEFHSGAKVLIDSERFRRVIVNVLNNAVDAMREKGPFERKNQLTVSTQVIDGRLEIVISDTGCGIPDENMDRIFEPLFSTKSFGVGLGLSIVKSIMEQHGGGVEIDTQVGVGTSVALWLPMASDAED